MDVGNPLALMPGSHYHRRLFHRRSEKMLAVSSVTSLQYACMVPLGLLVGSFGTLIGAGGGFILAPVLLLVFPNESPVVIASISLAVVFLNALSGSLAYARMGRIHYRSGMFFAAASLPGAILGALLVSAIPRAVFAPSLGVLLAGMAIYLLRWSGSRQPGRTECSHLPMGVPTYSRPLAGGVSFAVGGVSSLLGIGGGIIHVPFLVRVLRFPTHVATATSHFVLAIMALAGTAVHVATGDFHSGVVRTVLLGCGVLAGAQVGAKMSSKVRGVWIIRSLAIALIFVGIRVLLA
jgi:uncharacterized protein